MFTFKLHMRFLHAVSRANVCKYINMQQKLFHIEATKNFGVYKTLIFEKQTFYTSNFLTYRYMAGHAKWQNIKNIKAEKDHLKSIMCNKYVRQVVAAIRDKGPDPKQNSKLANILEMARKENVPASTLDGVLKRAANKKVQNGLIELLGPGGCLVVLEYETCNISDFRRNVKVICRKFSAGIYPGTSQKWRSAYEQKGIIRVTGQLDGKAFDSEKMLDAAIEAGAEDVLKADEGDNIFYEFFSAPEDLNTVKHELEQKFIIEEAYVGFIPRCTVELSDEDKSGATGFLNQLAELSDVHRLYENIA